MTYEYPLGFVIAKVIARPIASILFHGFRSTVLTYAVTSKSGSSSIVHGAIVERKAKRFGQFWLPKLARKMTGDGDVDNSRQRSKTDLFLGESHSPLGGYVPKRTKTHSSGS
jgi:hypothetical protein